ncbi:hypothetical protein [Methanocalculus sp. MSAO_Arc2]|uniref:hypothetical protein n=1 Tax=Methanocalculus sp. MSAO_Arc2 TaxID=2293855 RepID=UPI0026C852D1
MSAFACPQCGAPVQVTPRLSFHLCEYCKTTSFIDRSGVMFYYLTPFIVDDAQAQQIFSRWLSNPSMAKNLDIKAEIKSFKKILFPVYRFVRMVDGQEELFIRPARGTLIQGMQDLVIHPGTMKIFDSTVDIGDTLRLDPEITMDSYLPNLSGEGVEQSLVYVPLYEIEYTFDDENWHAVIDGSSGAVHASTYPMRSSLPFGIVFIIGFMAGLVGLILGIYVHWILYGFIPVGIAGAWIMANSIISKDDIARAEG